MGGWVGWGGVLGWAGLGWAGLGWGGVGWGGVGWGGVGWGGVGWGGVGFGGDPSPLKNTNPICQLQETKKSYLSIICWSLGNHSPLVKMATQTVITSERVHQVRMCLRPVSLILFFWVSVLLVSKHVSKRSERLLGTPNVWRPSGTQNSIWRSLSALVTLLDLVAEPNMTLPCHTWCHFLCRLL